MWSRSSCIGLFLCCYAPVRFFQIRLHTNFHIVKVETSCLYHIIFTWGGFYFEDGELSTALRPYRHVTSDSPRLIHGSIISTKDYIVRWHRSVWWIPPTRVADGGSPRWLSGHITSGGTAALGESATATTTTFTDWLQQKISHRGNLIMLIRPSCLYIYNVIYKLKVYLSQPVK